MGLSASGAMAMRDGADRSIDFICNAPAEAAASQHNCCPSVRRRCPVFLPRSSLRIPRHARPRQQFIGAPPPRQRPYPLQPCIYRGMVGSEIVPGFFLWVLEVSDYGQVDHGRPLTNHEGLVSQVPLQDAKEIIKPVF